jgi:hypothetical protein
MSLHDYFIEFISNHKNSNMLLIQDVKYTNVPKDSYEVENLTQTHLLKNINPYSEEARQIFQEAQDLQREIIRGVRFKNHRGDEICIGIPKKIQGILGLPFSEFDSLRCRIEELTYERQQISLELEQVTTELNKFKNMSFWNKLLFLFGIKIIKIKKS